MATDVDPVEDLESQHPIPTVWRPTLEAVVEALVRGDCGLAGGIDGVTTKYDDFAEHTAESIDAYGDVTLVALTEETWQTSVAMWMGDHWDLLVDLRTEEEGRSDLVLRAFVHRTNEGGYATELYMVYVP